MTTSQVIIQEFQPAYQDQVIDLIVPIQQDFGIQITADDQPDLKTIPQFYQRGNGNFWIALDDDRVVGTVALVDIGSQQVALRKMFTHPDYRGKEKGVAARLLETVFNWARDRQVIDIYLGTTDKFLAAHRFYEKNGFVEMTKADLPPNFPVMGVDSKFYRYQIR
jgi:GNAT superfamily N-acetyltransferase